MKVNVDAAFFHDTTQVGIGMVLGNEMGEFIRVNTLLLNGCYEVDVGETLGFY